MIDIKKITKESTQLQALSSSRYLWIIVACIPLLLNLPSSNVPIWALGLVIGGWVANKHPLRWIALAWLISVFFPPMSFLVLACCGVLLKNWKDCIYAALLGSILILIPIPEGFRNIGVVLVVVGLFLIIYKRIK